MKDNKRREKFNLLLFFAFFSLVIPDKSQDLPVSHFPYENYSIPQGLSQPQVRCLHIDSRGFLWVGTKKGINRFDGNSFENFNTNKLFPDEDIFDIAESPDSNIWFSSTYGLYEYNKDTIINHLTDVYPEIQPNYVSVGTNGVWFTNGNKSKTNELYFYDYKNSLTRLDTVYLDALKKEYIHRIKWVNSSSPYLLVVSVRVDEETKQVFFKVWKLHNEKLNLIEQEIKAKGSIRFVVNQDIDPHLKIENKIFQVTDSGLILNQILDHPYHLAAQKNKELVLVKDQNKVFKQSKEGKYDYGINFNLINDIEVDQQGRLWMGHEEGVTKIKSEQFINYPRSRGMPRYIWNIMEGDQEEMWFSSYGKGLAFLKDNDFSYPTEYKKYYPHDFFYMGGIKTTKGNLLFPHNMGVMEYHYDKGFLPLEKANGRAVLAIFEDSLTQKLYLCTDGLKVIDLNANTLEFYSNEDGLNVDFFQFLNSIEKDTNNIFWLGSHHGFAKFDGEHFQNYYKGKHFNSSISSIHKDYRGNLWLGGSDGLFLYDYSQDLPKSVLSDIIKKPIAFITSVSSKYLIVGSGINLYIIKLDEFYNGHLIYRNYNFKNSFDGWEFGQNGIFKDNNSDIWIITHNMVIKLLVEKIEFNEIPTPKAYFSKLRYKLPKHKYPIEIDLGGFNHQTKKIKSTATNIELEFGAIDFYSPSTVQFKYKLQGKMTFGRI